MTPPTDEPGFARAYGATNFAEDIATCAEILFHPEFGDLKIKDEKGKEMKVAEHPLLQRKLSFLKDYYSELLNLDSEYWANLHVWSPEQWISYWNRKGKKSE